MKLLTMIVLLCTVCIPVCLAQEGNLTEEELIGQPEQQSEAVGEPAGKRLNIQAQQAVADAYENARRGATTFFVGFGLELAVATPMAIIAVADQNPGLALGAVGIGLLASGLETAGPIRCGVGGSMAYDQAVMSGTAEGTPNHWGFYKAGWAFVAGATVLNMITNFSSEPNMGIALTSTGLSIAGSAMWITSCVTSLRYAKGVKEQAGLSSIRIHPYLNSQGAQGVTLSYTF